jgi:pimeloyl-ACP methyl ester carboxylesterase
MPLWKIILYSLLTIVLGLEAVVLAAVWQRGQNKNQNSLELSHGIERLITLKLNGADQYFLIRGEVMTGKPVVIYLHHGPGHPAFPDVRWIGRQSGLEQDALMIYWEPRGSGKSWNAAMLKTNSTVDDYLNDVCTMAQHFRAEYEKAGVVLMGVNFGGYLAARATAKCPNDLIGAIAIDPWLKKTAVGPLEGSASTRGNWKMPQRLWWLATTPEYDWREAQEIYRRGNPTAERMAAAINDIDLAKEIQADLGSLKVEKEDGIARPVVIGATAVSKPLLFLHATEDQVVPRAEIEAFVAKFPAQEKDLIWIDRAGHNSVIDAPAAVGQAVKTRLAKWMEPIRRDLKQLEETFQQTP